MSEMRNQEALIIFWMFAFHAGIAGELDQSGRQVQVFDGLEWVGFVSYVRHDLESIEVYLESSSGAAKNKAWKWADVKSEDFTAATLISELRKL